MSALTDAGFTWLRGELSARDVGKLAAELLEIQSRRESTHGFSAGLRIRQAECPAAQAILERPRAYPGAAIL